MPYLFSLQVLFLSYSEKDVWIKWMIFVVHLSALIKLKLAILILNYPSTKQLVFQYVALFIEHLVPIFFGGGGEDGNVGVGCWDKEEGKELALITVLLNKIIV